MHPNSHLQWNTDRIWRVCCCRLNWVVMFSCSGAMDQGRKVAVASMINRTESGRWTFLSDELSFSTAGLRCEYIRHLSGLNLSLLELP